MNSRRSEDVPTPVSTFSDRRSLLTSSAAILALIGFAVVATLAIPIKQLMDQRDRINDLQSQQNANLAMIERLETEVIRWQDPAYVIAQARTRLHYVMPTETGYLVLGADEIDVVEPISVNRPAVEAAWYSVMWESIAVAGDIASPQEQVQKAE
jgi:cell division protein FtsB